MTPDQLKRAEDLLNPKEREALKRVGTNPANKLAPATAAEFFALFLQGYSCEKIAEQNPNFGSLGLGLIVRARIEHNWDLERDKHIQDLMVGAKQALEKSTLDAIQFTSDGMAVFHKLVGNRFRKYLQTGDEECLGDFRDMSFKSYRDFVALLKTLTASNTAAAETPRMGVEVVDNESAGTTSESRPVTSGEAADLLALLVQNRGKS